MSCGRATCTWRRNRGLCIPGHVTNTFRKAIIPLWKNSSCQILSQTLFVICALCSVWISSPSARYEGIRESAFIAILILNFDHLIR
jgi:hypothetical protein